MSTIPANHRVPGAYLEDRLINPSRVPRQLWAEVDPGLPRIRLNRQGKLAFVLVEADQPFRAVQLRRGGELSAVPVSPSGERGVSEIRFYLRPEGGEAIGLWRSASPKILEVGDSFSLRFWIKGGEVVRGCR